MKQWINLIIALSLLAVLNACNSPEQLPDKALVLKGIEASQLRFTEAVVQGNLDNIVSLHTDDATLVPPNGDLIMGTEGVKKHYGFLFGAGLKGISFTTIETKAFGNTAYEIGKNRFTLQAEGNEPRVDSAKYLIIWQLQADKTWKISRDIWNLQLPMIDTLHMQAPAAE